MADTRGLRSCSHCFGGVGKDAASFFAKVERFSTASGNLTIRDDGKSITAEVREHAITVTHRLSYRVEGTTARLVNYSGGYIKDSAILGKVVTAEYVALTNPAGEGRYAFRSLDCGC